MALGAAFVYASYLLIYALPSITVGGNSPGEAILDSAGLARYNAGPTLILIFAGIVMGLVVWGVNAALAYIGFNPVLATAISIALEVVVAALGALFTVRFYTLLSVQAAPKEE